MSAPTGDEIALFLGKGDDANLVALAGQHAEIVTAMAFAYTRGRGFDPDVADDIAAVIITATARLLANPNQLAADTTAGPYSTSVRGGFTGWTLAELFVLNRYRRRAQ